MGLFVKLAFCKILFSVNGGTFTENGKPILAKGVRGKCDRAFDCASCEHMHVWLAEQAAYGWELGWECDECLKITEPLDKASNIERHVQGFYQAGRLKTRTPDDPNFDPDLPVLEGCTRCGWESSFLQLVMRRPR